MLVYADLYCTKHPHSGLKCIKNVGGWGSAPDPAGRAYSAPPDPLAGFGEGRGRGGGREGRGGEGEGRGGEGRGREGEGGGGEGEGEGGEGGGEGEGGGGGGEGRRQKERPGTTFFTL